MKARLLWLAVLLGLLSFTRPSRAGNDVDWPPCSKGKALKQVSLPIKMATIHGGVGPFAFGVEKGVGLFEKGIGQVLHFAGSSAKASVMTGLNPEKHGVTDYIGMDRIFIDQNYAQSFVLGLTDVGGKPGYVVQKSPFFSKDWPVILSGSGKPFGICAMPKLYVAEAVFVVVRSANGGFLMKVINPEGKFSFDVQLPSFDTVEAVSCIQDKVFIGGSSAGKGLLVQYDLLEDEVIPVPIHPLTTTVTGVDGIFGSWLTVTSKYLYDNNSLELPAFQQLTWGYFDNIVPFTFDASHEERLHGINWDAYNPYDLSDGSRMALFSTPENEDTQSWFLFNPMGHGQPWDFYWHPLPKGFHATSTWRYVIPGQRILLIAGEQHTEISSFLVKTGLVYTCSKI